jgi:hypothetical protein
LGRWLRLQLLADVPDQPLQRCVAVFLFDEIVQLLPLDLLEALEIAARLGRHR